MGVPPPSPPSSPPPPPPTQRAQAPLLVHTKILQINSLSNSNLKAPSFRPEVYTHPAPRPQARVDVHIVFAGNMVEPLGLFIQLQ